MDCVMDFQIRIYRYTYVISLVESIGWGWLDEQKHQGYEIKN